MSSMIPFISPLKISENEGDMIQPDHAGFMQNDYILVSCNYTDLFYLYILHQTAKL